MQKTILLLLTIASFQWANAQLTLSGVTLPKKILVGEVPLQLNGGGIRTKYFMDMYVIGLYLKTPSKEADKIIEANDYFSLKLQIVSSLITSEKMIAAIKEGFENATNKNTAPIKKQIDEFIAAFKDEIKKGDVFDIFYVPNKAVMVVKNGKAMAKIEGFEFKKALLGIWLSEKPADKDIKKALLGL